MGMHQRKRELTKKREGERERRGGGVRLGANKKIEEVRSIP